MLSKYRYGRLKNAFMCIRSYDEFLQEKEKFRLLDWCNDVELQAHLIMISPENKYIDFYIWVLTTYGLTPPDYELKEPIDELDKLRYEFLALSDYDTFLSDKEKYRKLDWLSDPEIQQHLGEIDPCGPKDFNGMEIWLNDTYGILSDALVGYYTELEKRKNESLKA